MWESDFRKYVLDRVSTMTYKQGICDFPCLRY